MFGKTHSEEARMKISKARMGHKLSEEHLMKIKIANTGPNNHNYGKTRAEAFGYEQSWNVGIPMTEKAKTKKLVTIFNNSYHKLINRYVELSVINEAEKEYAENLFATDLDKAVAFLMSKKISFKWNYDDFPVEYREKAMKLNQSIYKFAKKYEQNKLKIKEAS